MSEEFLAFDVESEIGKLARERLETMEAAGERILNTYRLLRKTNENLVGKCLAHQGTFYELDHYPKGDIYDAETHSQYYYHAHRPESGEHGHFHTFLRAAGMPDGLEPVPYSGKAKRPIGNNAVAHIVAISMDGPGFPFGMFTTNRWVTDETFYPANDVMKLLDYYNIDHTKPCLSVNTWITAMMQLFRPQIKLLLKVRDENVKQWAAKYPKRDVYEDREFEITSNIQIDVDRQIKAVQDTLGREERLIA